MAGNNFFTNFIKKKISNQIILFVIIIFIFQFVASCFLYFYTYRFERNEIIKYNETLLKQSNEIYLSDMVENISKVSLEMFYDTIFWDRYSMSFISSNEIYDVLSKAMSLNRYIDSIYLYSSATNSIYIMDQNSFNDIPIKNNSSNLFRDIQDNIEDYEWYSQAKRQMGDMAVSKNKDVRYGTKDMISFSRYLQYPLLSSSDHYIVSFNVNITTFSNLMKQICEKGEILLIFENNGKFIYGNYENDSGESGISEIVKIANTEDGWFTSNIWGQTYIVIQNTSKNINWRMTKMIPQKAIIGNVVRQFSINCVIMFLIFIVGIIILYFLLLRTTRPLGKLSNMMSKYQKEEIEIDPLLAKRKDEIGVLYRSFENMVTYINYLIESKYQSQIQEKQAKLEVLQTQLNPHFLYNTLQTISGIAIDRDVQEIERISASLSHILRYSLNKNKGIVKLSEEMENVKDYLEIQKYRYGDRISLKIELSEEVLECFVPVFALQLPVENSIKHGLEKKIGNELIEIFDDAVDNSFRRIYVKDNGQGIPKDKIDEINEKFFGVENKKAGNEFGQKGLRNLNLRLKYYFGNQHGISIMNNSDEGVILVITIPYCFEETDYDPNNYR